MPEIARTLLALGLLAGPAAPAAARPHPTPPPAAAYPSPPADERAFKPVYTKGSTVAVTFRDNATEDGDRVSVVLNGEVIAADVALTRAGASYTLQLRPGVNRLVVTALNEGTKPTNTFEVRVDRAQVAAGAATQTSGRLRTDDAQAMALIAPAP